MMGSNTLSDDEDPTAQFVHFAVARTAGGAAMWICRTHPFFDPDEPSHLGAAGRSRDPDCARGRPNRPLAFHGGGAISQAGRLQLPIRTVSEAWALGVRRPHTSPVVIQPGAHQRITFRLSHLVR